MDAVVAAALGCSLTMVATLAVLAWSAPRGRHSAPDPEVAALRAEIADLCQSASRQPGDEPTGRG